MAAESRDRVVGASRSEAGGMVVEFGRARKIEGRTHYKNTRKRALDFAGWRAVRSRSALTQTRAESKRALDMRRKEARHYKSVESRQFIGAGIYRPDQELDDDYDDDDGRSWIMGRELGPVPIPQIEWKQLVDLDAVPLLLRPETIKVRDVRSHIMGEIADSVRDQIMQSVATIPRTVRRWQMSCMSILLIGRFMPDVQSASGPSHSGRIVLRIPYRNGAVVFVGREAHSEMCLCCDNGDGYGDRRGEIRRGHSVADSRADLVTFRGWVARFADNLHETITRGRICLSFDELMHVLCTDMKRYPLRWRRF